MKALDSANAYLRAGLSVLPGNLLQKNTVLSSWDEFQKRLPDEEYLAAWFKQERPICIVTGAVSGNLEMIDFDNGGEMFDRWMELVEDGHPGLVDRLYVERTQSGGWHVVYRHEGETYGNTKLAERAIEVLDGDEVELSGKKLKPRRIGDQWLAFVTLIETRGEGGFFLCAPSPGYETQQGSLLELPVLTEEEREFLLECGWALNEYTPPTEPIVTKSDAIGRPGDDYNERADVRETLREHGWTNVRSGENEYWRRPGKSHGVSATLKDGVFYVFSTNAAPFENRTGYSPFHVYTLLEHSGDFSQAACELRRQGYGDEASDEPTETVDLSAFTAKPKVDDAIFNAITSQELAENDYTMKFLIKDILVRGQPMIVAAPRKTLKTNTSVDMALALAEGGLYLDRFDAVRPVRVGMMSGESGAATIQETALRIAASKRRRLPEYENAFWAFDVPNLSSDKHIQGLKRFVERYELEVLILDPTYLMLVGIGDGASNLFTVGSFLKPLGELSQEYGLTTVLCHHLKKTVADPYEPAELDNIAWAGFQEYMRQWILLNRRVRYDPDLGGHHELWLSVGGSAGHSGLWGINIDEGTLADAGGRRWEVEIMNASEAYEERAAAQHSATEKRKERERTSRRDGQREAVLSALQQFPDGETPRVLRELARVGCATMKNILEELVVDGLVEPHTIKKHTREESGFRITQKGAGLLV